MGDGVIGSPPAFGAVQSRFESESPSTLGCPLLAECASLGVLVMLAAGATPAGPTFRSVPV